MEVMLILIPVTVGLVALALWGFIWSVQNEQFDDLDKQAYSILFDKTETDSVGKEEHQNVSAQISVNTKTAKTPEAQ